MLSILKHKYTRLVSDKKFSEILTGSALALAARVAGTGLALLASILVARIYGAEMMGVLAIVQAFMMMTSIFALLGTGVSILRLIPEHLAKYSVTSAFLVYRKTQYLVAWVSVLVGGLLFFGADLIAERVISKPHFKYYISVTALCIIFRALMDLNTQAVRGLRLIRTFAFMQMLPNAAMLLILLIMMVLSRKATDPFYAQLAAWGTTALIGALIMARAFRLRMQPNDVLQQVPLRKILTISTPMLITASLHFIIGQVGVLVLGMYRYEGEVGYYSAAVKLATLTSFVLQSVNSMAAPKFSELFHTGCLDDLFHVAKKSTMLIFWTTAPVLFFLVVLGRPILTLFGEGFAAAYLPMLILVVGQFVNSVSGSTGPFLNMTGDQKVLRNIMGIASIINLAMSFALIPSYGMFGAAIAGTVCVIFWNVLALVFIKFKYGRTMIYPSIL